jgi:hypothetical protein
VKLQEQNQSSSAATHPLTTHPPQDNIQAWGQQCSPNCACTVRFETTIDPTNQYQITSASYHAKTVVSKKVHVSKSPIQYENGFKTLGSSSSEKISWSFLQPILTQPPGMNAESVPKNASGQGPREGEEEDRATISSSDNPSRPLFKPCNCKTLHVLAKTIVQILPRYSLSQAQNQLEFSGSRSSPAFRYTVLKNLDLIHDVATTSASASSTTSTTSSASSSSSTNATSHKSLDINNIPQGHCYDLVEDALMACLHGYIPKPRRVVAVHATGPRQMSPGGVDDRFQRIRHVVGGEKGSNHDRKQMTSIDQEDETDESNVLDPLRYVRAAKLRALDDGSTSSSSSSFFNLYDASSYHAFMPSSGGQHLFSFPSSSSSSSSSSPSSMFSLSSMPSFHWMMNSSHDDGSHYPVDTLTQLNLEIRSMKENDGKILQQEKNVKNNDWVSYVDEKYS